MCNTALTVYPGTDLPSFVGGGRDNTSCGGTIAGGRNNLANAPYTFIGGGRNNTASGYNSTVGGGTGNVATIAFSTVSGGCSNRACVAYSAVGGGQGNTASGYCSFIGGGEQNVTTGNYSFVGAGLFNCATGCFSFVGGGGGASFMGCNNRATGDYSSVLGGAGNLACNLNSHVIGAAITTSANNWTYVNNLCQNGGAISDRRTKNTICDTGYRLCDIVKLRPVSFCWNYDASNSKKFGFIAQEVQEAIPDLVNYNDIERVDKDGRRIILGDGDPILQFDREAIYASYVNGFKDLKAENDALKARIEAIEEILERNNLA
jgi:hypothetical protein